MESLFSRIHERPKASADDLAPVEYLNSFLFPLREKLLQILAGVKTSTFRWSVVCVALPP